MRPIDKFILHTAHNLFPLNEYSEGELKRLITQFREEADDLNINISDEQLKKYIERFDQIKNSSKIQEKDLRKYSLSQLIKLVTSSLGAETPEDDEDQTPDIVYNEGGITIWNGSKEGNCILYGRGEKWCITRGSYGNYRYDSDRGYPTFYLAKNTTLSDSDKLSFVAIQVRDTTNENKKYVYTNRLNSPHESTPMSFSTLLSEVPWLKDIPNIKNILRYIPLSNTEKIQNKYENEPVSIREWIKFPFNIKKQYIVIRKDKRGGLFSDVSNKDFVEKYLPQYPQIAEFIAITPGVIDSILLLANLDKFSNQDRKSITSNLQNSIDIEYLALETLPFDVKKLLVTLNKWDVPTTERLYITKDGNTIVKLDFTDEISIGLYTAEDDYPNIKLNKRTAKYLLEYPELDKLPFSSLIKLATDGIVDKEFINKVIEKAKSGENSAIVVKKVEDGEILLDSNSFTSYKIKDDKISKIPFNSKEVQGVLSSEKDNTSFQQSAVNIIKNSIKNEEYIPAIIDKDFFINIIKSTPYDKRTITYPANNNIGIILVPEEGGKFDLFIKSTSNIYDFYTLVDYGKWGNWREQDTRRNRMDEKSWKVYFAWMRNENKVYEGNKLNHFFTTAWDYDVVKTWFNAQPPISPTDQYALSTANNIYYVVNKANPRESFKLSSTGRLVKANIPQAMARQLIGGNPDVATPIAQATPGVSRIGRPAGVPNTPRIPNPAAPAAAGNINVSEKMNEVGLQNAYLDLPRSVRRRLEASNGRLVNTQGDRGAARRNNMLGNAGRVEQTLEFERSKIYIIRLANQQIIASINIQPGNQNYILYNDHSIFLNSPSELMQALRQRNLAEVRNYIVREYLHNNPQHLDEVHKLIRQHVNETKTP